MRPPKISRDDLLFQCASTFKRLGYHGTTMDTLAAACGLTKASFYHHYPNKESLLRDVLDWTHKGLAEGLFAVTEVVESGDALARALEFAGKIALAAPLGVQATLESAFAAQDEGDAAALALLDEQMLRLIRSEDAREGVMAMMQKRVPVFKGR